MKGQPLTFGFALPCFNEAQNLGALLPILDRTRIDGRGPVRFIVVSDESRDGTDEIVAGFAKRTSAPVCLIANPERAGKATAINRCIRELNEVDVIVLVSGDVLPKEDCVRRLVEEFKNPAVGVAAGRPVAMGPSGNPAFEVSRFLWALHDVIATRFPKSTEITAFRNVVDRIDPASLVDEAELEITIQQLGLAVHYVPSAVIFTPSPLVLIDYLRQRAIVTLGYLRLKRRRHYLMKTLRLSERLRALATVWARREFPWRTIAFAIALEVVVRLWAWIQLIAGSRRNGIWDRSESTKRPAVLSREIVQ